MAEKKSNGEALFASLYERLSAPFPAKAEQRTKGQDTKKGYDTTGYGYQYIVNRFNEVCGMTGWDYEWKILREAEGEFRNKSPNHDITVKMSISLILDGVVQRPKSHVGSHVSVSHGDALKGAITNSMKKTAAMYGVGRQAYEDSIDDDDETRKQGEKDIRKSTTTKPEPAPESESTMGEPPEGSSMHENEDDLTQGEVKMMTSWGKSHVFGAPPYGNAQEKVDYDEIRRTRNVFRSRKHLEWWFGAGYKGGGERDRRIALEKAAGDKKPVPGDGATTLEVKRGAIETLLLTRTNQDLTTPEAVLHSMTGGEVGKVDDLTNNEVLRIHTELVEAAKKEGR